MSDDAQRQKAIEDEFLISWRQVEGFFSKSYPPMMPVIREMRARGYDQQMRAGQAMSTFFVSRSRERTLRIDQPSLAFDIMGDGHLAVQLDAEHVHVVLEQDEVAITPQIEHLLNLLLVHPID